MANSLFFTGRTGVIVAPSFGIWDWKVQLDETEPSDMDDGRPVLMKAQSHQVQVIST